MNINNRTNRNKEIINTIINDNRETIYDKEGTQINISKDITSEQHNQVIQLLKQFIHIFSTDTTHIKPAKVQPCQIKLKPNSKEPKFNPPHSLSISKTRTKNTIR